MCNIEEHEADRLERKKITPGALFLVWPYALGDFIHHAVHKKDKK